MTLAAPYTCPTCQRECWTDFTDTNKSPIDILFRDSCCEGCCCLADKLTYVAPPINEIGLSVNTIGGGVIDPYDIKSFHDSLANFPIAERQGTVGILNLATQVGGGSNAMDLSKGPPQKWWFVSSDQSRVVQAQDNFISYNWRRSSELPGQPVNYPGFDEVLAEFKANLELIEKWHNERDGTLPSPAGCELLYDNIIPLVMPDDTPLAISDVLVEFNRAEAGRLSMGWTNQWMEEIDGFEMKDQSILRIQINVLGLVLAERDTPLPVIKLMFTAGAARSTWEDTIQFFEIAHAHIRKRFLALIDGKVQSTWNQ